MPDWKYYIEQIDNHEDATAAAKAVWGFIDGLMLEAERAQQFSPGTHDLAEHALLMKVCHYANDLTIWLEALAAYRRGERLDPVNRSVDQLAAGRRAANASAPLPEQH